MQYKTITIEHPCRLKNNVASTLNTEYESIINKIIIFINYRLYWILRHIPRPVTRPFGLFI